MNWDLTAAEYDAEYRITVTFRDGTHGTVDLKPIIDQGGVFAALEDLEAFKAFSIDPDWAVLTWQNGRIDIAPETLYELATGHPLLHVAETTTAYGTDQRKP